MLEAIWPPGRERALGDEKLAERMEYFAYLDGEELREALLRTIGDALAGVR